MKTPIRTCIICKSKADKASLLRINYKDNVLSVDNRGNKPGRGAYVCNNSACIKKLNMKSLNRAMKGNIDNKYNYIIENLRKNDMDD